MAWRDRSRLVLLPCLLLVPGCLVDEVCFEDLECGAGSSCDLATGRCKRWACESDADCDEGEICNVEHRCEPRGDPIDCPEGMVSIKDLFCIDIYEASRPDADEMSSGSDSSYATSRYGVVPWRVADNNAEAQAACTASGKDLCTEQEWFTACQGPVPHDYAYGDDYDPAICNGIDKFCSCEGESPCASHNPCPYAGCFWDCRPQTPFHLEGTGTNPGCTNAFGVFDMNGNVWEHVRGGSGSRVRGGAFNCGDSVELHRCDYIPGNWTPSALGFRCCWRPDG
ncbi:MAG: SUMF1/EgtB/PvdO family nonheme iron enzyme [Deltaproteobacteria bacterium]|nr:SUMF1/EgtB/PvdO family nonheme iron enzyme [Deltaproteobacteria bacterium]